MAFVLALDQGTSSSRAIVFDDAACPVAVAQRELPQIFPRPGWVEHDPERIWSDTLHVAREAIERAGLQARDLAALGITNQRETTVIWERATGRPIHNAIVWQDRRTEPACAALRADAHAAAVLRERTGLVVDPYFSGTKIGWLLDHVPGARNRAERGELAFGTVDTWLAWKLSGGRLHVTDATNASRTLLWNLARGDWDDELLALLGVPRALLPAVLPSSAVAGDTDAALLGAPVPIAARAGDQQAALFGQACFAEGMAKNTYGTGCFALAHAGGALPAPESGLIVTATACGGFALEGSVFTGGAVVQWLRDGLGAIRSSGDVEALAASVPDSGGVVFVPAFTGLGAPWWRADARGAILGLSRGSGVAHVARAALESIAFQSASLLQALGRPVNELRVDGGAAGNDLLMQFQADLLGVPVLRPAVTETTALGAAWLAGLATGVWRTREDLAAQWRLQRAFHPTMSRDQAEHRMARWTRAVRATLADVD